MQKFTLNVFLVIVLLGLTTSCFNDDRDDNLILASEINDFVWKGMNVVYLYKDEIPNLANDRFSSDQEYANYLNGFSTPEDLFESVIYLRETVDRFSWIVDDYIALEQSLGGTSTTNGLRFYSFSDPGSSNLSDRILVIRQVVPNSTADNAGLIRGQYIIQIDGTEITSENVNELLSPDTYTLHFANLNDNGTPETTDDTFTPNGITLNLTKTSLTENPVHETVIIDVDGEKLGYILYNRFNPNFESELNNAFGEFVSNNVQHLVLDLRYNPGGRVDTETFLASMITGQFIGQVFTKLIYNNDLQVNNTDFDFTNIISNGNSINSLGLNKVYVLTTGGSASASEGLINGLSPYIEVVQIGVATTGKTQASITIYDSPELVNKDGINPNHTYAMQPLVANATNVDNQSVPSSGLIPDIEVLEDVYNLGLFGDVNEPLLAAAIANITGSGRTSYPVLQFDIKSNDFLPFEKGSGMYIDNTLPKETFKRLIFNQ